MEVRADIRWMTAWIKCKKCETINHVSNKLVPVKTLNSFCEKCRDITEQELLHHELDVRAITFTEKGYGINSLHRTKTGDTE